MKFRLPLLALIAPALFAASADSLYQKRCASCHDSGDPKVPSRDALKKLSVARVARTLDFGTMAGPAGPLNREERDSLAAYLGNASITEAPPAKAFCAERSVALDGSQFAWNGWSPSANNTRYQPAAAAGLGIDQVRNLKLKWAYGFDGDIVAFSAPTVAGRYVFIGSANGAVQALRADTGCAEWIFQAGGPVRSAILIAQDAGKNFVLFGDQFGSFYALQAENGKLLWKKRPEPHESTRLTASPVAYQGTVFVPAASWEETRTNSPDYACCTFRGSVTALRIKDGSQVWKTFMIPEKPKITGKTASGVAQWGPSGASVWSAPTLDVKRKLMYVTTGDNFSTPATNMSDAVVALDLATGKIAWAKQTTPGDVWTSGCNARGDCPGPDHDYGSSALLEKADNGREVLLAGQKSGVVYALDPDRKGEILWQVRVGKGGINGGVQWGMASDGQRVYAATSDVVRGTGSNPDKLDPSPMPPDSKQGGGLTALRISDGNKVWFTPPVACGAKPGCSPAQSGAVTAIPGVVFSGSLDGHLRAYTAEDGRVLWDFDTARAFDTVNGVSANGGAVNGPGAVVAGGMVFLDSGYGRSGLMSGNVLLVFGP